MAGKEFKPEDMRNAVNHSGLTLDEVADALKDSVEIRYGDRLVLQVESHMVALTREQIAMLSPEEREQLMAKLDRHLKRNVPKILAGKYTKKRSDNTMNDLVLWHVLHN